jgi:predicted O-linked N-acetylglucosamine transferase (SPINDLY family)
VNTKSAIVAAMATLRGGNAAGAIVQLEALVASEPDSAEAYNALGSALGAVARSEPAIAAFERALSLRPQYPEATTNLGSVLLESGRIHAALEAFEDAASSGRAPPQAYAGAGRAACLLGRFGDAQRAFERAVAHPSAQPFVHSQRCYAVLLDPEADARRVVAVHRDYEVRVAAARYRTVKYQNDRHAERRLVVGYVSADFREHSVACFMESIVRAHDFDAFDLVAYSDAAREDATTAVFRGLFPRFRPIAGRGDAELAALVVRDQVDVLIDLAGHMQPNRLPVFALAPAPVSFTYLGYPGSTGMSVFHARITDSWADPTRDSDLAGPEPQIHVKGGYFAYAPPSDAPDVSPLPAETSGFITFGSMNDLVKVNDVVLRTWAEVLKALPSSRLFLKAKALSSADLRERVLRVLAAEGVSDHRIDFEFLTPRREHLARYSRIDLLLDPFPYSGATTTCEALYTGVPVLNLAGDRHAARLSTSILEAVGLGRFVTHSRDEYVRAALRHAEDIPGLSRLRRELRATVQSSPLLDGARVARAIEHAARDAFRSWSRRAPI